MGLNICFGLVLKIFNEKAYLTFKFTIKLIFCRAPQIYFSLIAKPGSNLFLEPTSTKL